MNAQPNATSSGLAVVASKKNGPVPTQPFVAAVAPNINPKPKIQKTIEPKTKSITFFIRILTVFLARVSPASTIMFAATMGVLWLGVVPLVSGLIVRLFGLQHFNTLFGFAFLSHQVGAFVGAWLGGLSFDLTGSYTMAWGSMVVIGTCAFLLQWFMDDQPRPTRNRSSGLTAPAAA